MTFIIPDFIPDVIVTAGEDKHRESNYEKSFNNLPRTVLRSNTYVLLDGEWKFSLDLEDQGLRKGWHLDHDYAHVAQWPGSVETHIASTKGLTKAIPWHDTVVVWYERTFELPKRAADYSHLMYNLADELGLLLWVEVPSPHSSSDQSRKNHKDELHRMLSLIETNPSIVLWSLYNEDWGAQDIATNSETRDYITQTYHYLKTYHPQFLVVDNDGWRHISQEGKLKSDLLTVHIYTPDIERWTEVLAKLSHGEMNEVAAFPLVVGDPFFYRGQVPIVVSEWGGFGFVAYGGPKGSEDRAEKIKIFKQELRKHRIAGDIYTQATNIEDERNGLIDGESGNLSVPAGLLTSNKSENGEW